MFQPIVVVRILFILGVINLVTGALIFFSCRCMAGIKFVNAMFKYNWYQKYYSRHCYYWWFFIISVAIHATVGFLIFGIPFP